MSPGYPERPGGGAFARFGCRAAGLYTAWQAAGRPHPVRPPLRGFADEAAHQAHGSSDAVRQFEGPSHGPELVGEARSSLTETITCSSPPIAGHSGGSRAMAAGGRPGEHGCELPPVAGPRGIGRAGRSGPWPVLAGELQRPRALVAAAHAPSSAASIGTASFRPGFRLGRVSERRRRNSRRPCSAGYLCPSAGPGLRYQLGNVLGAVDIGLSDLHEHPLDRQAAGTRPARAGHYPVPACALA